MLVGFLRPRGQIWEKVVEGAEASLGASVWPCRGMWTGSPSRKRAAPEWLGLVMVGEASAQGSEWVWAREAYLHAEVCWGKVSSIGVGVRSPCFFIGAYHVQ